MSPQTSEATKWTGRNNIQVLEHRRTLLQTEKVLTQDENLIFCRSKSGRKSLNGKLI